MMQIFPFVPSEPPPGQQELMDRLAAQKFISTMKLARRALDTAVMPGGLTTDRVVVALTKEECALLIVLIDKEIE